MVCVGLCGWQSAENCLLDGRSTMGPKDTSPPGPKRQAIEGCPMGGSRKKNQVTRCTNWGSKRVQKFRLWETLALWRGRQQGPLAGVTAEEECKRRHFLKKRQKEEKKEEAKKEAPL